MPLRRNLNIHDLRLLFDQDPVRICATGLIWTEKPMIGFNNRKWNLGVSGVRGCALKETQKALEPDRFVRLDIHRVLVDVEYPHSFLCFAELKNHTKALLTLKLAEIKEREKTKFYLPPVGPLLPPSSGIRVSSYLNSPDQSSINRHDADRIRRCIYSTALRVIARSTNPNSRTYKSVDTHGSKHRHIGNGMVDKTQIVHIAMQQVINLSIRLQLWDKLVLVSDDYDARILAMRIDKRTWRQLPLRPVCIYLWPAALKRQMGLVWDSDWNDSFMVDALRFKRVDDNNRTKTIDSDATPFPAL